MPKRAKEQAVGSKGIRKVDLAKEVGCTVPTIYKAVQSGRLREFPDGTIDPECRQRQWLATKPGRPQSGAQPERVPKRGPGRPPRVDADPIYAPAAHVASLQEGESPEEAAERIVHIEGRAPFTLFEAQRIKENFLALTRQLEYDIAAAAVVPVADVQKAVATEYATVRGRLMSIAAEAAPRLAVLRTASECQALLDEVIAEVLENLTLDDDSDRSGRRTVEKVRERIGHAQ